MQFSIVRVVPPSLPFLFRGVVRQELDGHEPVPAVAAVAHNVPGAVLGQPGGVGDVDGAEGALGQLPAEAEARAGQRGHHVRLEAAPHRAQRVRVLQEAAGILKGLGQTLDKRTEGASFNDVRKCFGFFEPHVRIWN